MSQTAQTTKSQEATAYRWLNANSKKFLEESDGYLLPGQTVPERVDIICNEAERILKKPGYAKRLKRVIEQGWCSLSTPIWSNFGTGKGLGISCFSSYIDDTMASLLETQAEVGMMTKLGGGTSAYFGNVRGRGAQVTNNGHSAGSVHFMQLFNTIVGVVSQGSRRGSFAAYLPVDHPDIEEFLRIKSEGFYIQDISFGVCIPEGWMQSMIDGDVKKRKLWAKILETRANVGYPYILFLDNVNSGTVDVYKDKEMRITNSNLCVAPETELLTKQGNIAISKLEGKEVEVWNGRQWSKTKVVKTGVDQKLIKVQTSYSYLYCTPYHKFYINGDYENPVPASDLKTDDSIETVGLVDGIMFNGMTRVLFVDEDCERDDDTYCVNEPLEHKVVFNGLLTGNCSEINLPTSSDESFVCDLASMNILYYDEWKDTDAVEVVVYLLDAVMTDFIEKASKIPFMHRAVKFAERHRALGLGWLGWHSFLQSKIIAWESMEAKYLNVEVAKCIQSKAWAASEKMAKEYGMPKLLQDRRWWKRWFNKGGYGRRHTTLTAIAPTKSSSFILGQVSEGIEPATTNYDTKDTAKGKFPIRNVYLQKLLEEKGFGETEIEEIWLQILKAGGSVQNLSCLTDHEKQVFKTFAEISPKEIIILAAQRQKYIDQSQSLNLMIHPTIPIKEVNALIIEAWKMGVKSLYYQKSVNAAQTFSRNIMNCTNCEA
jgi:ribonucleotide reductase alpha subunit